MSLGLPALGSLITRRVGGTPLRTEDDLQVGGLQLLENVGDGPAGIALTFGLAAERHGWRVDQRSGDQNDCDDACRHATPNVSLEVRVCHRPKSFATASTAGSEASSYLIYTCGVIVVP
jgi:hypothetical protein